MKKGIVPKMGKRQKKETIDENLFLLLRGCV